MQSVERLLSTPGGVMNTDFPGSITLAELRLRWEWDPLRSNARFQKILVGPERKTVISRDCEFGEFVRLTHAMHRATAIKLGLRPRLRLKTIAVQFDFFCKGVLDDSALFVVKDQLIRSAISAVFRLGFHAKRPVERDV